MTLTNISFHKKRHFNAFTQVNTPAAWQCTLILKVSKHMHSERFKEVLVLPSLPHSIPSKISIMYDIENNVIVYYNTNRVACYNSFGAKQLYKLGNLHEEKV